MHGAWRLTRSLARRLAVISGEKYGAEAQEATSKYSQALEEVKVREMSIIQLQKRIAEGETKLKQQQVTTPGTSPSPGPSPGPDLAQP